ADGPSPDELAAQAAEVVRNVLADAEARAAEITQEAERQAAKIRERAEADPAQARERAGAGGRPQSERASRGPDRLGGALGPGGSAAVPPAEESLHTETAPGPHRDPEPEPAELQEEPAESSGAPEAPISPPAEESRPADAPAAGDGDDAAERLVAMKLAIEGKDPAAIEAELIERFGPGDRSELLPDVVSRADR